MIHLYIAGCPVYDLTNDICVADLFARWASDYWGEATLVVRRKGFVTDSVVYKHGEITHEHRS